MRVTCESSERLIHVGDQRHGFLSHSASGFDHQRSQPHSVFFLLHERAGTRFYIEHERVDPFCKLLAHDGGANQAYVFDCRSHVAQRIDLFVRRSNLRCLADQAHAALAEDFAKLRKRKRGVESWDRFELVQRSARVAEPAAADHRHSQAASSNNRRKNQRSLVPHSARGVLVYFFSGEFWERDDFARMQHRFCEARDFRSTQPANPGGHQPRSHLVIGNFPARVAGD